MLWAHLPFFGILIWPWTMWSLTLIFVTFAFLSSDFWSNELFSSHRRTDRQMEAMHKSAPCMSTAGLKNGPIFNPKPPLESSGSLQSKNLRNLHAHELPTAQIRNVFMSRWFHVLQYSTSSKQCHNVLLNFIHVEYMLSQLKRYRVWVLDIHDSLAYIKKNSRGFQLVLIPTVYHDYWEEINFSLFAWLNEAHKIFVKCPIVLASQCLLSVGKWD